ncbi:hypothetical protein BIFADO_01112 [Bifidobacterium adolescentis L2-32]|uniref:Uncharacterized protein n=1 Tax=Bifidobacterium adolescentis L2-32 TaxID=411481 RepID=A7A5J3_BIFAD|nr:hypothetical protein BIFADO_01112 [Bifidobacterium adolescentis L2-32]
MLWGFCSVIKHVQLKYRWNGKISQMRSHIRISARLQW